ncbi:peptidoglycan-associated lipoprotein Pal [Marinobacterium arenosum]|uniref:peptidoglycan-associated lipoprotein Pal n=1 Tax=Marinobacterium arenosum TaxID=2862496 RepID=UPI001C9636FE|nr:peptidoglycan-associated lipoprotein Pal [Marinobacterium arenosum]MBY4675291.1 peptidoglycan-associated lipoprotein Pal [Marinobacterium arenosum]
MRATNLTKAAALALTVVWAAGCSTTGTTSDSGADAAAAGAGTGAASAQGVGTGAGVSGGSMQDVANLRTVFYFDFDKSVVKAEGFADLEAHAKYLALNPGASIRLEGHADERGTREYNMALGERRAKAISRFLQVNNVNADQLEVISYGEEKPAVLGHDRGSWSQNRRVELKYVSR